MDIPHRGSERLAYRPDIDGLRAFAVILVLIHHVGLGRFPGGFIGVDMFFVLSGYLIGGNMLRDLAAGTFSFAQFYERRFRRIFPALLVMLFVTSIFAYLFLFPAERYSFVQTEAGALASISNVLLMHQFGYFDTPGKLRPLLHTWSLGVEEQFYLLFPLLLFAIHRLAKRYLKPILWVLTAIGFGVACLWVGLDGKQAFFLAPLRAWEFLLGVLLAARAVPALDTAWKRNAASLLGVLLILRPALIYQEWTPFPGWNALAPCIGTLLLLAAGEMGTSVVGRLLALPPIRFIGVISYSLYLWHWPIHVFQTMSNVVVPDRASPRVVEVAVIAASIALATLSWRFVETPFRTGRLRARRPLFLIQGTLALLLAGFSLSLIETGGWLPGNAPLNTADKDFVKASPTKEQSSWQTCFFDPADFPANFPRSSCLHVDPGPHHYLLLGDSHAAHLAWGLHRAFPQDTFSMAAATGCPPLYQPADVHGGMCDAFLDLVFNQYLANHPVDTVLLAARWFEDQMDQLNQTIAWIQQHGMKVVVIGPAIEFDASLIRLIELAHREHDPALLARHRNLQAVEEDRRMATMARDTWHVPYISMYDDLCNPQVLPSDESAAGCPVFGASAIPLLWDADHISPAGSDLFAQAIRSRNQLP